MRVRRFMRLRVAHLPQKPFSYSIIHQNKNRLPSAAVHAFSQHPGIPVLFSLGAPPQIPAAITMDSSLRLPSH